jgi:hypothetical protein
MSSMTKLTDYIENLPPPCRNHLKSLENVVERGYPFSNVVAIVSGYYEARTRVKRNYKNNRNPIQSRISKECAAKPNQSVFQ